MSLARGYDVVGMRGSHSPFREIVDLLAYLTLGRPASIDPKAVRLVQLQMIIRGTLQTIKGKGLKELLFAQLVLAREWTYRRDLPLAHDCIYVLMDMFCATFSLLHGGKGVLMISKAKKVLHRCQRSALASTTVAQNRMKRAIVSTIGQRRDRARRFLPTLGYSTQERIRKAWGFLNNKTNWAMAFGMFSALNYNLPRSPVSYAGSYKLDPPLNPYSVREAVMDSTALLAPGLFDYVSQTMDSKVSNTTENGTLETETTVADKTNASEQNSLLPGETGDGDYRDYVLVNGMKKVFGYDEEEVPREKGAEVNLTETSVELLGGIMQLPGYERTVQYDTAKKRFVANFWADSVDLPSEFWGAVGAICYSAGMVVIRRVVPFSDEAKIILDGLINAAMQVFNHFKKRISTVVQQIMQKLGLLSGISGSATVGSVVLGKHEAWRITLLSTSILKCLLMYFYNTVEYDISLLGAEDWSWWIKWPLFLREAVDDYAFPFLQGFINKYTMDDPNNRPVWKITLLAWLEEWAFYLSLFWLLWRCRKVDLSEEFEVLTFLEDDIERNGLLISFTEAIKRKVETYKKNGFTLGEILEKVQQDKTLLSNFKRAFALYDIHTFNRYTDYDFVGRLLDPGQKKDPIQKAIKEHPHISDFNVDRIVSTEYNHLTKLKSS